MRPKVDYARVASAGASAAYRVFGDGPRTVFVSNWISNIDALEGVGPLESYFEGLEAFCRLLSVDQLGVGQSDVVSSDCLADRGVWADTVAAVLDREHWVSASIIGYDQAALAEIAFASVYPDRIDKLVLTNPVACYGGSKSLPQLLKLSRVEAVDWMMAMWATPAYFRWLCPSAALDEELCERWARWQRACLSPARARAVFEMVLAADVSDLVERVECPTLIIDTGARVPSQSAALADRISGATLVNLGFGDHFPVTPVDTRVMLAEICDFLTGHRPDPPTRRALATICFTDIVGSTQNARALGDRGWVDKLKDHDSLVESIVSSHRGRVVKRTGDGVLAVFETPTDAVHACGSMRTSLRRLDLQIRAGIHAGEVEVAEDGDLHGLAVHIAARIASQAAPNQILASAALRSLTSGSSVTFDNDETRQLAGIGQWQVVTVQEPGRDPTE